MAQATEAQVRTFERAHKDQLYNLAIANKIWLELAKKVYMLEDSNPKKIAVINYGKKISPLAASWVARQRNLETKGGVPNIKIYAKSFFSLPEYPNWVTEVNKLFADKPMNPQLGIIPLIIWGVIAIVAAFSAAFIVDETNTTAQEKEALLKETGKTCKELNLSTEDCKKMITQTQQEVSSEGGMTTAIKWGVGLGFAFLLFQMINSNKTQKA